MSNKASSKKFAKLAAYLLPGLKISVLLCLISFAGVRLHAQALPAATNAGVLQAGGEFNYADSDYVPQKIKGGGAYVGFDFKYHWGIEAEFHQINDSDPTTKIYERTYEIGPRYVLHFHRIEPFAKGMYGRGIFNYPEVPSLTPGGPPQGAAANLAYNIVAAGLGVDYRLLHSVNVRVEYESQKWFFPAKQSVSAGLGNRRLLSLPLRSANIANKNTTSRRSLTRHPPPSPAASS